MAQEMTGVQRFAYETTRALDETSGDAVEYTLVVPKNCAIDIPRFKHIKCIRTRMRSGLIWEQILLPLIAKKDKASLLNLCNSAPAIKPDYVCVHDVLFCTMPSTFSLSFVLWYKILMKSYGRRAKHIFTVSKTSASQINSYYPELHGRMSVVTNGWEHFKRIDPDYSIVSTVGQPYYFSLGSLTKNRNIEWLLETAKLNKSARFVIAGGVTSNALKRQGFDTPNNVMFLGRLSDAEIKALMKECEAFISPSLYEGFGVPPLEALSCGTQIIISNIDVYKEVYGESAHYIDPSKPCENISSVLAGAVEQPEGVLKEHSWRSAARLIDAELRRGWAEGK